MNLKRLRGERGLTQGALAEKAELSLKMIQKIEYGQSAASSEAIDRLCVALECRPSEFYAEPPKPPAPAADAPAELQGPLLSTAREADILEEFHTVLEKYAHARLERRLLALYILTHEEHYLARYEALPSSDRQVVATLKRSLGTS